MVADWMGQRRFDVAVCDFLASAPNFPLDLATPTVLFQHNVETVLWKRRSKFAANWMHRIIANAESAKMVRYETEQVRRFDHVLAVSEYDRQAMSGMRDTSRISVLPTGVDLAKYRYDPESRPVGPIVVFVGSMDWEPNIDGVEYFCKDIWPRVIAQFPGAIFRIVGRDPHRRVRNLASASVTVTGTVPSVVEPLREAAVVVVPLRMGGGTRIKIYEGMALGKATVSTNVGAEGLNVHDGFDILLADDPSRFAEHIVALLRNDILRRAYEKAAAAAVRTYDWGVIADLFVKQLEENIPSIAPVEVPAAIVAAAAAA
jgi:glycosyltransferase involved in cell wall biosynthesis